MVTTLGTMLINRASDVGEIIPDSLDNIGSARESIETLVVPRGLTDAPDATPLTVAGGEIRFEAVGFAYDDVNQVFHDLSLTIPAGQRVGLIGTSGAGKSTLIGLLLRLHDVQGGRVLIDGQDIRRVTQESLRGRIGVIPQDTQLFHRTLRENISYGRPGADDRAMIAAAQSAYADEFIRAMPAGYDTMVGERGVKLSGGQRQRIAIARAFLKDAPILILDEATSALDSESEGLIQKAMERAMRGRTVIAIAHRLSTIAHLDRLVVLEKGRIVEDGSHADLLAKGGVYARLWKKQSGGFLDSEAGQGEPASVENEPVVIPAYPADAVSDSGRAGIALEEGA
jgi:ABC-type multidrug transport system fused ATPase/permease subunit